MLDGLVKSEGSPGERLWGWVQARVIRMDRSQWDGRALALAEAAIAAWRENDPRRPAAGFFEWASDLDRLAAWDQSEPADKGAGLRAYLKNLPGYGGDPMSSIPYEQHGYMAYRAFDEGEASRRFVERACDEPENFEALALAGFEALKWPESEELALEGMSLMEACELERSAATPARARDGESGRL